MFTFDGRASLSSYWLFTLIVAAIFFIAMVVDPYGILLNIAIIVLLLPSLAMSVKRLHDIDRSGFWILISFIPIVNFLLIFILYLIPGTDGENHFGPEPGMEVPSSTEKD